MVSSFPSDFPAPPPGTAGWPWTSRPPSRGDASAAASVWPRISIVTPSYNQAAFLEETIRSVLLQGYPNLEYIVLDGGSTDGSVEVIRKYAPWLAYWANERDKGQVHALAKGFALCSGEILAFLNSDDVYFPDTFQTVVRAFSSNPNAVAICGDELWIDAQGQVISEEKTRSTALRDLLHLQFLPQPAIFIRRSAYEAVGGLDVQFQYIFDFELWLRLANGGEIHHIPKLLAATRWHTGVKRMTAWPTFPMELECAIPKLLAGPLSISLSPAERKAIYDNLMNYAAKVYLWNYPRYVRKALSFSMAAIAGRPSALPSLLKAAAWRTLQLLTMFARKLLRRERTETAWWAGKESGVHWTDWRPSSSNT